MLLRRDVQLYCERQPFRGGIALHIAIDQPDANRLMVAQPLVFVEGDDTLRHEPVALLHETIAQRLMDELWNCGLRPSEGAGSAGSLAATEKHLADMRTLAFHVLKVQA